MTRYFRRPALTLLMSSRSKIRERPMPQISRRAESDCRETKKVSLPPMPQSQRHKTNPPPMLKTARNTFASGSGTEGTDSRELQGPQRNRTIATSPTAQARSHTRLRRVRNLSDLTGKLTRSPPGSRVAENAEFEHLFLSIVVLQGQFFRMTPHATRFPAFPVGSVTSSSGSSWITRHVFPEGNREFLPGLRVSSKDVTSTWAVPFARTSKFGRSPA